MGCCLTSLGALQTSQQVDPAPPRSLPALLAGGWGVSEGQVLGALEKPRQNLQSVSGLCLQLLASHAPMCAPPLVQPLSAEAPSNSVCRLVDQRADGKHSTVGKGEPGERFLSPWPTPVAFCQGQSLSRQGPPRSQRVKASPTFLDGETKAQREERHSRGHRTTPQLFDPPHPASSPGSWLSSPWGG